MQTAMSGSNKIRGNFEEKSLMEQFELLASVYETSFKTRMWAI